MTDALPVSIDDVRAAAQRLRGITRRTPLLPCDGVLLKCENLQVGGAFKLRGAYNAIAAMAATRRAGGVVAASSGNHAQAVARAARLHGIAATILMPADAPAVKLAATRDLGAEIVSYDRYGEDREALLATLAAERGLPVVHPFDDAAIVAGQGTVALEVFDDAPDVDVLVVPVGGGGLISGCAVAASALTPGARVVGVEPASADDARRSLAAGERVRIDVPRTIADGQAVQQVGALPFTIMQALVDEIVTVGDDEIAAAMRHLFERAHIVAEPSGACALAAVLNGRIARRGTRIAAVVSGGNVDPPLFARLTAISTPEVG